jgi:hypothetical protein
MPLASELLVGNGGFGTLPAIKVEVTAV